MTKEISRRSFLQGIGLAGAATVGAGLAGCAPAAPAAEGEKLSDTGDQAHRWSWEAGPEDISEDQIAETVEHEFVVVGAGLAGLATAASLAENGGDVLVVEKNTTWASRGSVIAHIGALNTPRWVAAGVEYSKFDVFRDWDVQNGSRMDNAQVWTFLERSGEALEWSLQKAEALGGTVELLGSHYFGEKFPEYYGTVMVNASDKMIELEGNGIEMGKGNALHFSLYQSSLDNGAQYLWSTPGKQLVVEDGKVTGIICVNADGDYVRYKATKGVILATGDISGDEEMSACFAPIMNRCQSSMYIPAGMNTGDGQKMAIWAGAKMQDGPWPPMIHPQGYGMFLGPFMCTNSFGQRFMNEDTWTQGKSLGILNQPGDVDYGFCVFDKNYSRDMHATRKIGGGLMWDSVYRVYGNDEPDEMYDERILGMGIDGGFIYQADTLEEAAALVKADYPTFDEDLFLAEVARYNELVAAGEDTDFGKRADLMLPIAEAPFFIEKVGPNKMCAPGGALITGYGQVIDEEENPIEGLYAVGNCSGGLYAVDYPLVINGNSHGRCITFGYLLGRQLTGVEEVQSYPTRA